MSDMEFSIEISILISFYVDFVFLFFHCVIRIRPPLPYHAQPSVGQVTVVNFCSTFTICVGMG